MIPKDYAKNFATKNFAKAGDPSVRLFCEGAPQDKRNWRHPRRRMPPADAGFLSKSALSNKSFFFLIFRIVHDAFQDVPI